MNTTLEPTGGYKQAGDKELLSFLQKRWSDKSKEYKKREPIRNTLSKFMMSLLGSETNKSGAQSKADMEGRNLYTSSLMVEAHIGLRDTKLFADRIDFTADQNGTDTKTIHEAKNLSLLGDFTRTKGEYDTMVRNCNTDLLMGECFYVPQYMKDKEGVPKKLNFKHVRWECVRPWYGDDDLMVLEELTVADIVEEWGEDILKFVTYGNPIDKENNQKSPSLDEISMMNQSKKVGVLKYWNPKLKKHYCALGGNGYMPDEGKLCGDNYPEIWTDSDGDAFCPVERRVYHEAFRGYHGFGVFDLLYPLAYLETVIVNSSSHASVLASDPMLVFYSEDIKDAKKRWKQYLANKRAGQHSDPLFLQNSNPITKEQVSFQPDINLMSTWKEFCMKEATRRAKIDFELITTPTADQQRLRKQEFDKVNTRILNENAPADKDAAMRVLYMLKNGDSEFHDKEIFLEVGDYFYEDLPAEEVDSLKKDGQFPRRPVKISDFLEEVETLEFVVTPRLEGIVDDQTFYEIQDVRADLGLVPTEFPVYRKLLKHFVSKKYGGIDLVDEDFVVQPVQQEAPAAPQVNSAAAAAAQAAAAPLANI